jgi:hypothetical protein
MNARLVRRALALAGALCAATCAGAPERSAEPGAAGCYQFERGTGARTLGLPWGMELADAPLDPGWPILARAPEARRALTANSPTARADHPFGYWLRAAGDTIEVGYPGPGAGIVLRLAPAGQDLMGVGRAVGDAVPPGEPFGARAPAPVTARRVLCGAS